MLSTHTHARAPSCEPLAVSGAYCASKAAFHSLNEAMRMEMAPFGVEVLLVQLGGVLSALVDKSNSGQLPARCPAGAHLRLDPPAALALAIAVKCRQAVGFCWCAAR